MAQSRAPIAGRFTAQEVALATRNSGMPLEALRYDLTPAGLHYLLIHFDIPAADAESWRLEFCGEVERPFSLGIAELRAMAPRTERVTLECAGNGRGQIAPRYPSVPWLEEGVSTAAWTGVPLARLMDRAGLRTGVKELVFHGADRGIDRGVEHEFARSLSVEEALRDDVLLAYQMNGADLLPQHGAPLRLIVPGWYGMASVKWLQRIEALARPFDGIQQGASYHFRAHSMARGIPCRRIRVNSLMAPPGIPDFYTRTRSAHAGAIRVSGRAWSGNAPIVRVEFGVDGAWQDAALAEQASPFAWRGWHAAWNARPGIHELACRATDAAGNVQPLDPLWDLGGFGNNAIQRVSVTVAD
jgi:DMSO/TMAO reductase YedYZ molybdopterin-dependent catalytic subunit